MANPFVEIERKYRSLAKSYEDGSLDADGFAQALAAMEIQDEEGQWWQIQGNGKWLHYNGESWEEAVPPRPTPPPPPRSALLPPPRPRNREVEEPPVRPSPIDYPAVEEDDSIFRNTGVPPEQIPGLLDSEPPPGAFLIEAEAQASEARPLAVKVENAALSNAPQRPQPAGQTPIPSPPQASHLTPAPQPSSQTPVVPSPQPSSQVPVSQASAAETEAPQASCWKCHKKLFAGAKFCKYCGARPGDAPHPQAPVAEAAPVLNNTCANCHNTLVPTAKFCGKCGHPVGATHCPQCHTPAPAGARFCKQCGHKLS